MNDFKTIQDPSPISRKGALLILVTYFIGYIFVIPLILYQIDAFIPGFYGNPYVDVAFHTVMTLVFLKLGSKLLQESSKHMNMKALIVPILAAPFMLYGSAIINVLMTTLSGQTEPVNQAIIVEQFNANRLPIMVQVLVFAPIVEEILFRGIFYRHLKKAGRYLVPLIFSTLLFATLHSLSALMMQQWTDLWYIPVYAFMAVVLAYTYEKTQNLYSSIFLHFVNNAISILAMLYALK